MAFAYVNELYWKGKVSMEDWKKEMQEKYGVGNKYEKMYSTSYYKNKEGFDKTQHKTPSINTVSKGLEAKLK